MQYLLLRPINIPRRQRIHKKGQFLCLYQRTKVFSRRTLFNAIAVWRLFLTRCPKNRLTTLFTKQFETKSKSGKWKAESEKLRSFLCVFMKRKSECIGFVQSSLPLSVHLTAYPSLILDTPSRTCQVLNFYIFHCFRGEVNKFSS